MSFADLLAFNLILAAALISPGPALLFSLRTAIADGRMAGILAGCGLAFAAGMWTLAALLGLDHLFALFPWAYVSLKIAGVAYLFYLAIKVWRGASKPIEDKIRPRGFAYRDGALINLSNPKSVFYAAVMVLVFPKGLSNTEFAIIVGNHIVVEILFYSVFAILLSGQAARRGYLGAKPVIDRIAALLMGALGLKILLDRG